MDIQQAAKVYNRAYDAAFTDNRHAPQTVWIMAGIEAVAEWAREQTLEEARGAQTSRCRTGSAQRTPRE